MKTNSIIAVLFLIAATPLAAVAAKMLSPAEVVTAYCQCHESGLGLSSRTNAPIGKLVLWRDEPGWDTCLVIAGFHLIGSETKDDRASVDVSYEILGAMDENWVPASQPRFSQLGEQPVIHFVLKRTKSGWKIAAPLSYPRVGLAAAIHHLEDLIVSDRQVGLSRANVAKNLEDLRVIAERRKQR